mgnify:CR=1 FL=1
MKSLGLDLSLRCTGIVLIEGHNENDFLVNDYHIVTTLKGDNVTLLDVTERCMHIASEIMAKVDKHKPDVINIESLSYNSHNTSSRHLAMLLGVVLNELVKGNVNENIIFTAPMALKKYATGKGNASKKDVMAEIQPKCPNFYGILKSTPQTKGKFDLADAFWLGLLGIS